LIIIQLILQIKNKLIKELQVINSSIYSVITEKHFYNLIKLILIWAIYHPDILITIVKISYFSIWFHLVVD